MLIQRPCYPENYTGAVTEYDSEIAVGIGALLPQLDQRHNGTPINETILRETIVSPYHDQLIAIRRNIIVGAASMSMLLGSFIGRAGRLEDFVVEENLRGSQGRDKTGRTIAQTLWDEMIAWCQSKSVNSLTFESEEWREAAHRFYIRNGAVRDADNVHFYKDILLSA